MINDFSNIVDLTYIPSGDGTGDGSGYNGHNKGWFAIPQDLQDAHPTAAAGDYAIVGSTETVWIWSTHDEEWTDTAEGGMVQSVNGKTGEVILRTSDIGVTTMPAPTAEYNGKIYQYVGETNADYTQGSFYICEQQNSHYSWVYLPLTEGAVHLEGDETITGNKNFTGEVSKNGNKLLSVDDIANAEIPGVGKVNPNTYGIGIDSTTKSFKIQSATEEEVAARSSETKAITPSVLNKLIETYFPVMTQDEYDSLATKDPNVFYMIREAVPARNNSLVYTQLNFVEED